MGTSWATVDFDLRVEDVVNAVITLLDSPYMSGLEQYRVTGSGTLVGSLLATDSDPPAKFKDTDVMNEVVALVSAGLFLAEGEDWKIQRRTVDTSTQSLSRLKNVKGGTRSLPLVCRLPTLELV